MLFQIVLIKMKLDQRVKLRLRHRWCHVNRRSRKIKQFVRTQKDWISIYTCIAIAGRLRQGLQCVARYNWCKTQGTSAAANKSRKFITHGSAWHRGAIRAFAGQQCLVSTYATPNPKYIKSNVYVWRRHCRRRSRSYSQLSDIDRIMGRSCVKNLKKPNRNSHTNAHVGIGHQASLG